MRISPRPKKYEKNMRFCAPPPKNMKKIGLHAQPDLQPGLRTGGARVQLPRIAKTSRLCRFFHVFWCTGCKNNSFYNDFGTSVSKTSGFLMFFGAQVAKTSVFTMILDHLCQKHQFFQWFCIVFRARVTGRWHYLAARCSARTRNKNMKKI